MKENLNKYLVGVYVLSLLVVYQVSLKYTGFSMNTPAYGLFGLLIFFYSISENLKFSNRNVKYESIYINALIFVIFSILQITFYIF